MSLRGFSEILMIPIRNTMIPMRVATVGLNGIQPAFSNVHHTDVDWTASLPVEILRGS